MKAYVYRWSLRPEEGLALEVRVTASSAIRARREIRRFLVEHDGSGWCVECVSREAVTAHQVLVTPLASGAL